MLGQLPYLHLIFNYNKFYRIEASKLVFFFDFQTPIKLVERYLAFNKVLLNKETSNTC